MMNTHASAVIIESQPLMRAALSTALTAEGVTVLAEIAHGRDVKPGFPNQTPDMLLFSLGVPDQDDLETLSSLRRAFPRTAIVALVTGELPEQVQAALAYGAHLVVEKSVPRAVLLEKLNKLPDLVS